MSGTSQWSYVDSYIIWLYSVSHFVITPDVLERPPRPAHEEILENEQIRDDHAIVVFPICQNIMRLMYEGMKSGLFERGDDDAVSLARAILPSHKMPWIIGGKGEAKGLGLSIHNRL